MPKARYALRDRKKPKGVKTTAKLSGKRLLSRLGKRLKPGTQGAVSEYIPRTRAVKRLQVTLRDFRRLCILKGIYPREPKNKKHLDPSQTYYHYKDIQFLSHEPLMRKFHEQKVRARALAARPGGGRCCAHPCPRPAPSCARARRSSCAA
jgi:pescadillo protein